MRIQRNRLVTFFVGGRNFSHQAVNPTSSTFQPGADLVGPPDPVSHLRPVLYAPLLRPPKPQGSSSPLQTHPYSLSEFPSSSSETSIAQHHLPHHLRKLKVEIEAADFEWTFHRKQVDKFAQDFWHRTNTEFESARQAYITKHGLDVEKPDVDNFLEAWINDRKNIQRYTTFNREWWSAQLGLVVPEFRIKMLKWKWKWAVFFAQWRRDGL